MRWVILLANHRPIFVEADRDLATEYVGVMNKRKRKPADWIWRPAPDVALNAQGIVAVKPFRRSRRPQRAD